MYERDEEVADFIGHLQKRYGWPKYIRTTTGKNRAERIVRVMRKAGGLLPMTAAVQSMNSTVLANIERDNIKLDAYATIQEEVRAQGMQSYGELVLCLPGETKATFLEGISNLLNSGVKRVSAHQLMRAPWICIIPADGQVDEMDVVRLYEVVAVAPKNVMGKVRRRFRMDGLTRKFVSVSYNLFVRMLWPRLASWDINGSPKMVRREHLSEMQLQSKDWFLDAEIMIKAHALSLRILEVNVFARMRGAGLSHVRSWTCWEFFRNLIVFRFSGRIARPRAKLGAASPVSPTPANRSPLARK